jgi:hypothetical protein
VSNSLQTFHIALLSVERGGKEVLAGGAAAPVLRNQEESQFGCMGKDVGMQFGRRVLQVDMQNVGMGLEDGSVNGNQCGDGQSG